MAETFSYTNSSGSTKTLAFDGELVEGSESSLDLNQLTVKTKDKKPIVQSQGESVISYNYSFILPESSVSESDFDDFKEFISSTFINGTINAFAWTDYNSVVRSVYLMSVNRIRNEWRDGESKKIITVLLQEKN